MTYSRGTANSLSSKPLLDYLSLAAVGYITFLVSTDLTSSGIKIMVEYFHISSKFQDLSPEMWLGWTTNVLSSCVDSLVSGGF